MLRALVITVLLVSVSFLAPPPASALDLTQRKIDVAGKLTVGAAAKIADKLIGFDAKAQAPIYLMVTATAGTAQGVMLIADTIRSLSSPVVSVVVTQVHGTGAALAPFADQVVIYPSAGLVFTEIEYEGVKKPDPPKEGDEAKGKDKEPEPTEKLLQQARQDYLARFYERLARRLYRKPAAFRATLASGGFVLSADDAVKQKVAAAVVDRISFTPLPEVKKEVKIETSQKKSRLVPVEDTPPAR